MNPLGHTKEGQSRNYTGFSHTWPGHGSTWPSPVSRGLHSSSPPWRFPEHAQAQLLARRSAEGTWLGSHVLGFAVCCPRAATLTAYSVATGWRGAQASGNWAAGHPRWRVGGGDEGLG